MKKYLSLVRIFGLICLALIYIVIPGCSPFDKIYSHEFGSGYFKLKGPGVVPGKVYLEAEGDSLIVYPAAGKGNSLAPNLSSPQWTTISSISPGGYLYNNTFVKTSADIDLSTVLLKYRPHEGNVPPQLSYNVNGVFYIGFRKDFFKITSHVSAANVRNTFIRHTGFDFGPFAGIGITPVNPTVTMGRTIQEYDGIVFQKGFAIFGTFENMSVGISLGFDNLLDKNRSIWIYNQKPWIGLLIGIANF
jgi:hypothetical protein